MRSYISDEEDSALVARMFLHLFLTIGDCGPSTTCSRFCDVGPARLRHWRQWWTCLTVGCLCRTSRQFAIPWRGWNAPCLLLECMQHCPHLVHELRELISFFLDFFHFCSEESHIVRRGSSGNGLIWHSRSSRNDVFHRLQKRIVSCAEGRVVIGLPLLRTRWSCRRRRRRR